MTCSPASKQSSDSFVASIHSPTRIEALLPLDCHGGRLRPHFLVFSAFLQAFIKQMCSVVCQAWFQAPVDDKVIMDRYTKMHNHNLKRHSKEKVNRWLYYKTKRLTQRASENLPETWKVKRRDLKELSMFYHLKGGRVPGMDAGRTEAARYRTARPWTGLSSECSIPSCPSMVSTWVHWCGSFQLAGWQGLDLGHWVALFYVLPFII